MSNKTRLENGEEVLIDFSKLRKIYQKIIADNQNDVIPVVVQDVDSKEVLVLAYVNEEALLYSLQNKVSVFWSTSRDELWVKGRKSGNVLELIEVRVNCEQNSLLYLVRPVNKCGACHVKDGQGNFRRACFYSILVENKSGMSLINQSLEV